MSNNKFISVLIIYPGVGKDFSLASPKITSYYKQAYEDLYDYALTRKIKLYRAPLNFYNEKTKAFKKAWCYENGKWKKATNIKPDLVCDKVYRNKKYWQQKQILAQDYRIANDPNIIDLIDNKLVANKVFAEHTKPYFLISSKKELTLTLKKIKTKTVVLKPIIGTGGKGIFIGSKTKAVKEKLTYPLLAQDFIDSSLGYKGLVKGVHDFRLVIVNEKVSYAYFRLPKPGLLKANLALGGSMQLIPKSKIPKSALDIFKSVRKKMTAFNYKIYTIDFVFDAKGKPWVIELNSMPAYYFPFPEHSKTMYAFYDDLLENFRAELTLK